MCFLLGGKGKLLQAEEEKAREKKGQNRIPGYLVFIAKQKNPNKTHKNSILPKNGTRGGALAGREGGREGSSSLLAIFFLDLVIEAWKQNKNSKIYKAPTTTKDYVL
jgi:hypothetical protein